MQPSHAHNCNHLATHLLCRAIEGAYLPDDGVHTRAIDYLRSLNLVELRPQHVGTTVPTAADVPHIAHSARLDIQPYQLAFPETIPAITIW